MLAIKWEKDKIVEMLIKRGIDLYVKNNFGQTALHLGLYKIQLKY
jgi:ankyrin repeat protein